MSPRKKLETEKVYKDKEEKHKTDIKDNNQLIELLRSWLSQVKQVPLSLKTLTLLPPPALKTLEQLMETMIPKGIEPLAEGTLTRTAVDTNLQAGGDPLLENPNAEKDHEGAEMKLREEPREEPQQSKESRDDMSSQPSNNNTAKKKKNMMKKKEVSEPSTCNPYNNVHLKTISLS